MKKNISILTLILSLIAPDQSIVGSDIDQNMVEQYYIGRDAIRAWNTTTRTMQPALILEFTFSLSEFTKNTLSDELLMNLGESISLGKIDLNEIRNSLFHDASDLANYVSSYVSVGKKILQHKLAQ